jgi:predicted Zn-dependent protease
MNSGKRSRLLGNQRSTPPVSWGHGLLFESSSIYYHLQGGTVMKPRLPLRLIGYFFLLLLLPSCSTVPVTGRNQLNIVSRDALVNVSKEQYQEFISSHDVVTGTPVSADVQKVGGDIASAVGQYLRNNNRVAEAQEYNWEFNLIESEEVNAWAMPGGKVVVYSGILPVTRDETGLAVVMGHEIAHVIANHGGERMSQQLITQLGGQALSSVLAAKPQATQTLWMQVYGVGANLGVMLPYSRLQESEADRLGMIFMAMAGYDPRGAVDVWQRMAALKAGQGVPEFFSTHPADQTRIENIREFIPTAMQYYQPAP